MTGLILPCRGHGPETHSAASRSSLALCLRVSTAARLDAPAVPLGDPAELLQNLLAVRDAPRDLLERLRREQKRGPRHEKRRLTAWVVHALHEPVVDGAWRRDDLRGRHARHRDTVLVDLGGEALGEPLERGLLGAVAGPAAGADGRIAVGTAPGADRGARRDVDDRARTARDHVDEHQLAQDEGRVEVHGPRAHPAVQRIVLHGQVVGQRGVVDEDVDGPVGVARAANQPLALGSDAAGGAGHHHDLAVELSHWYLASAWGPSPRAALRLAPRPAARTTPPINNAVAHPAQDRVP